MGVFLFCISNFVLYYMLDVQPFSVQGEKKAVRAAVNYLKKVLGAYNTTAEVAVFYFCSEH